MPFHLDVAEIEQALTLADAATRRNNPLALQAALEQVDSLYRGDLLPGCYDEWILPERDRLRQRHRQALEQLLRIFEGQGDTVTAIRYAQRLIGIDPLSEDLYRRLMRLFSLNNDRSSALRVYHSCVTILQREMGVDPSLATCEVYEKSCSKRRRPSNLSFCNLRPLLPRHSSDERASGATAQYLAAHSRRRFPFRAGDRGSGRG